MKRIENEKGKETHQTQKEDKIKSESKIEADGQRQYMERSISVGDTFSPMMGLLMVFSSEFS